MSLSVGTVLVTEYRPALGADGRGGYALTDDSALPTPVSAQVSEPNATLRALSAARGVQLDLVASIPSRALSAAGVRPAPGDQLLLEEPRAFSARAAAAQLPIGPLGGQRVRCRVTEVYVEPASNMVRLRLAVLDRRDAALAAQDDAQAGQQAQGGAP